jgi:g-D-glutamyl-meso-diaminopimelate peptidase
MIVDPTVPYTHAQMMRDIGALRARYPDLTGMYHAGYSVHSRTIPVLTLGCGPVKAFFCGAHHAREHISAAYLMYAAEVYAAHAQTGERFGSYDMAELLAKCTMHIMPMVNPDGVTLAQEGPDAFSNAESIRAMISVRRTFAEWKANANGVDLNRHYPAQWDKKHVLVDAPASEMYNGAAPATEPEVRAVMRVCRRNIFKSALSFHAKGEIIYWADAATTDKLPHAQPFAERLSAVSGYKLMPVSENPGVYAAGFENWFRQAFLYPAMVIELTPSSGGSVPHSCKDFFMLAWEPTKYICAEALVQTLAER